MEVGRRNPGLCAAWPYSSGVGKVAIKMYMSFRKLWSEIWRKHSRPSLPNLKRSLNTPSSSWQKKTFIWGVNDAAHRNMAELPLGSRREFGWGKGENEPRYSIMKSRYRHVWEGDSHSEPGHRTYLLRPDSSFEMDLGMCLDSPSLPIYILVFMQNDMRFAWESLSLFSFVTRDYF